MLGNVEKSLRHWRNFSEIFRKDKTYDNIKIHKKHGLTLSPEDAFLEKLQKSVKFTPPCYF